MPHVGLRSEEGEADDADGRLEEGGDVRGGLGDDDDGGAQGGDDGETEDEDAGGEGEVEGRAGDDLPDSGVDVGCEGAAFVVVADEEDDAPD